MSVALPPDHPVNESQILQALHRVPINQWPDVLNFIDHLCSSPGEPFDIETLAQTTWTAAALGRLPESVQDAVLRAQARQLVQNSSTKWQPLRWSPLEIGKLAREQRAILLEASAGLAASEYEENPDLTAFDALAEDDLYVDSSDTQPR